jgi:hypothetical protein
VELSGTKKEMTEIQKSLKQTVETKKKIIDMYRGINEYKNGYQPRTNLVKDQNGNLLTDSHSILSGWKSYVSHILNVYGANDVRLKCIQLSH